MEAAKEYGAFVAAGLMGLAGFALGEYALMAWLAAAVLACAGVVFVSPRWGTLSTALLALGCNLYLFERKLDASGSAICNVSAKINCDVVNSAPQSELFGVPIALFGAGFFLGVAVATLLKPAPSTRLYQAVGLLAAVGCVFDLYLAFVAIQIGAVCVMCITIYACSALLVIAAVRGAALDGARLTDGLGDLARSNAVLAIVVSFAVVVLVGQTVYASRDRRTEAGKVLDAIAHQEAPAPIGEAAPVPSAPTEVPVEVQLQTSYVTPRGPVVLEGDEPILGDPNAPYVVLEYACFGCPHCAQAFGHLKQLVTEMPEVQVRFRSFPLSAECNASAARGGRPEVCRAAMAAQCANRQGKFWEFSDLVFANQQKLGDELLSAAANQVGLDFDAFSSCMSDPQILREVQEDAASGAAVNILGTPTMFLKGATSGWIETCWGAQGVAALVQAQKKGVKLLEPASSMCPEE
ncbi:MAG: thioredoxin domain-containing protein [Myxococcota bacterium]